MSSLLTLTCPTCGAKLKLADKVNLLVCASCGNEHMVHRDGGAIYLGLMAQDVRQIRASTDKTAAELALARLQKEVSNDQRNLGSFIQAYKVQESQSISAAGCLSVIYIGGGILFAMVSIGFVYAGFSADRSELAIPLIVATVTACLSFAMFFALKALLRKDASIKLAHEQEVADRTTLIQQKRQHLQKQLQIIDG